MVERPISYKMIGIINYGVGNLQSVKNSLDYLNISNKIIDEPQEIDRCSKIILPGVGAFGPAMAKLNKLGFAKKISDFAGAEKPILGLCLGMQLLFETSLEDGRHKGLSLIKGKVLPFKDKIRNLSVPHVGWNNLRIKSASPLFNNIEDNSCFYFVHSFYCQPDKKTVSIGETDYGIKFASIVNVGNIFGCQFHPEKSQLAGLKLLENFSNF